MYKIDKEEEAETYTSAYISTVKITCEKCNCDYWTEAKFDGTPISREHPKKDCDESLIKKIQIE